jgi:uncharacterized membrane protein
MNILFLWSAAMTHLLVYAKRLLHKFGSSIEKGNALVDYPLIILLFLIVIVVIGALILFGD